MILIEGIPVVAARLAAEQKAKEWLAKTSKRASEAKIQRPSAGRVPAVVDRAAKAA